MVKAAALYIVIIVSILVAMISVSLLTVAFYYRLGQQKKLRFERLHYNITSGMNLLLSKNYIASDTLNRLDVYGEGKDSLELGKTKWGVFDLNTVKAFEQTDTLKQSFLTGSLFEDQSALYLADEDRPLSLSGSTQIIGNGELPKSGLKQAYVDGKGYEGKELIKGKIKDSSRALPALDQPIIDSLSRWFIHKEGLPIPAGDSVNNSFFEPLKVYHLKGGKGRLDNKILKGHLVLISDSILSIGRDVQLQDIQVFAPAILIEEGFKGTCQLFARDSIIIGKHSVLGYPSFAAVLKPEKGTSQSKIKLGEGSRFYGTLLSYEKERSELQTLISIDKNCLVKGEVYATGYIKFEKPVRVQGKVYAKRFIMQTPATLYENYLIDISLDRKSLSRYYLSSFLIKANQTTPQILKWLN
ncbi:hypothetical protein DBR11_19050 [Pedobacter sp. HMWF019]|uniref:hypothetical protein n=1 Tax=Pedobacter sp. HMWF019 TaxID=2056856 RepID=UPI000D33998C|nr:hypothetical protein [Pedobacter sp. HMWF019]PTS96558.1 hypothetical protein DBR11_19050 [Pedobacter sp. HMWF019]